MQLVQDSKFKLWLHRVGIGLWIWRFRCCRGPFRIKLWIGIGWVHPKVIILLVGGLTILELLTASSCRISSVGFRVPLILQLASSETVTPGTNCLRTIKDVLRSVTHYCGGLQATQAQSLTLMTIWNLADGPFHMLSSILQGKFVIQRYFKVITNHGEI